MCSKDADPASRAAGFVEGRKPYRQSIGREPPRQIPLNSRALRRGRHQRRPARMASALRRLARTLRSEQEERAFFRANKVRVETGNGEIGDCPCVVGARIDYSLDR